MGIRAGVTSNSYLMVIIIAEFQTLSPPLAQPVEIFHYPIMQTSVSCLRSALLQIRHFSLLGSRLLRLRLEIDAAVNKLVKRFKEHLHLLG
jgi:hypothetical protein